MKTGEPCLILVTCEAFIFILLEKHFYLSFLKFESLGIAIHLICLDIFLSLPYDNQEGL